MTYWKRASAELAHELATAVSAGQRCSVSFLNRYTAQVVIASRPKALSDLTVIGVDGLLLMRLLGGHRRTAADLVVPELLAELADPRVILVGGAEKTLEDRRAAIQGLMPDGGSVIAAFDGYTGLPSLEALRHEVHRLGANVVLMGLGAPLQEVYAGAVTSAFPNGGVSLTVGGYLDQIAQPGYYPSWAYPLGLNWLVRLCREPRRLWRRYTVYAIRAVRQRQLLRSQLRGSPAVRL